MDAEVYERCLRHAARVLPPDPALEPADLVQSAWLKVGSKLDTERPIYEQTAYLCLIIGQIAIDHFRKLSRRTVQTFDRLYPDDDALAHLPSPERLEDTALAGLLAEKLVECVPCNRGLALVLLYAAGWRWDEIGAIIGTNATTARTRAHRAAAKFKQEQA